MLIPATETEACGIIRDHAASRRTLEIIGGATRGRIGNPVAADNEISSRGLAGIVTYNPAEMVMTAKAGTPLAEIKRALDAAGQMMAFEPIDHRAIMATTGEPTIGGVFAVNASGPRRLLVGAARDHLLGLRLINGQGEIVQAGGRVMKNVTGLDLVKLMAGSHGTLGLLSEVTFKVLPRPRDQLTLVVSGLDDTQASRAMAAAMALPVEASAAAHLPVTVHHKILSGQLPDGPATVLRLEGMQASVAIRFEKLAAAMAKSGAVTKLDADESATLWREIRDVAPYADGTNRPLWRVSVAPAMGVALVANLRLEAGIDAFYDWQGGLVWMRMEADPDVDLVRRHVRSVGGGHATLVRAPMDTRQTASAFEPLAPAVALLNQGVREKFDPAGIFNPGRMVRQQAA